MSWQQPDRASWVQHFNALGENLADGGRSLVSLDPDQMLANARLATGLDDYGDNWFQEPFRVLLRSLEEEAELTLLGRVSIRAELSRLLESRLKIEELCSRYPEIEEQEVAPVHIVTGLGRTGTSILHELFTQDPDNRVPLQWEMMFPVPAPEAETFTSDERIAMADREIRLMDEIIPTTRTMHEHGGDLPNECIYILAHQFASHTWVGRFNIPSYTMWMASNDQRPAFEYHRRMLKLLQWRNPRKRWVLKAPTHLIQLPLLFDIYPQARVVITHRDPIRVLASVGNLVASLKYLYSNLSNYDAEIQQAAMGNAFMCQHMTTERLEGKLPLDQLIDVRYDDLMADPVATVRQVYENWGIPFSDGLAASISDYLASRPKDRHGSHSYSFADTGLNLEQERARYDEYQCYFQVPSEVS
jgi:sulfotransferase family protein